MDTQAPSGLNELAALEATLTREFGAVIGGGKLTLALGYSSQAAFRQAVARNQVPVRIFEIAGRRGRFALAHDIAKWLHVTARLNRVGRKKSPSSR